MKDAVKPTFWYKELVFQISEVKTELLEKMEIFYTPVKIKTTFHEKRKYVWKMYVTKKIQFQEDLLSKSLALNDKWNF